MAIRSAALRVAWLPLLLLALLPSSSAASGADWTSKLRTLNIAHQGGEDEAPSNTMYAYDRALRLGRAAWWWPRSSANRPTPHPAADRLEAGAVD